jgi:hypothetical protein
MLTTTDNPYDPFDQYEDWYAMDSLLGYNSPSYLARIAVVTEDLGAAVYHQHIEDAIDEIVEVNLTGTYKKVTREVDFPPVPEIK